jgi:hypothetical protein
MLRVIDRHAVQQMLTAGVRIGEVARYFEVSRRTIERIRKEPAVEGAEGAVARWKRGGRAATCAGHGPGADAGAHRGGPGGGAAGGAAPAPGGGASAGGEQVLPAAPGGAGGATQGDDGALRGGGRGFQRLRYIRQPELGIRRDALGVHALGRVEYEVRDGEVVYKDGGPVRVMVTEPHVGPTGEPTLRDVREALVAVDGTDYGIHSPTWISRFTDMTRQAAAYRDRRVLLAGDAAHVHPPVGGQGLNTGVQDAVNLGWKLAQVVHGTSPESLLDTYPAERHPVAARVLRNTMAQMALRRPDDRTKALGDYVSELFSMDEPRRRLAAEMSGLDIRYDFGEGHPLLGRRMPDLDLVTANGPLRVFTLLHDARPVLLNLGEPATSTSLHGHTECWRSTPSMPAIGSFRSWAK